jgi:hypothetical protein
MAGSPLRLWLRTKKANYLQWREQVGAEKALLQAGKASTSTRIFIGPANSAGQATLWAKFLTEAGTPADSMRITNNSLELFDSTLKIERLTWIQWKRRVQFGQEIASEYGTVFIESLRPLFAYKTVRTFTAARAVDDLLLLRKAKKKVAVIFHGSDIRDVDYQASINPFSPYNNASAELDAVKARAAEARAELPRLRKAKVPLFVTTPDLLHDVPGAQWLPVCIDVPLFSTIADSQPAFAHGGAPRILYLPSKSWVKSAEIIEPILEKLDREGVIQLIRTERVPHSELPGLLAQCDALVDQFIGVVGALALEAMAAGRLVLTHIDVEAYAKVAQRPPVLTISPTTLETVLRNLQPDSSMITAARDFVAANHDGKRSAELLRASTRK